MNIFKKIKFIEYRKVVFLFLRFFKKLNFWLVKTTKQSGSRDKSTQHFKNVCFAIQQS